jgi:hypothetical protein
MFICYHHAIPPDQISPGFNNANAGCLPDSTRTRRKGQIKTRKYFTVRSGAASRHFRRIPKSPPFSPDKFVTEIQAILATTRQKAATAVNFAMVEAYWLMGKRIVEEEQSGAARAQYGEGMIKMLSKALTAEFGKGFSVANLQNGRQFYLAFQDSGIHYTLCSELSWSHYRLLMRLKNPKARQYYMTPGKVIP